MTQGRLIAVVGPSGVGKDSVMTGIHEAIPATHLVRRVITRDSELGGEDFDPVSEQEFEALAANGAFAIHWRAHGLSYGIPINVRYHLGKGRDCLANLSRQSLSEAAKVFPGLLVLNLTASPEVLALRLAARRRETNVQIARRLAQASKPLAEELDIVSVSNDGALTDTIARAVALLQPVRMETWNG